MSDKGKRDRLAAMVQTKMGDHLKIVPESAAFVDAEFYEIEGFGPASYAIVDALSVNRDGLFEEMVKALEPFAAAADGYDPDEGDGAQVAWAHDFTIASLRRARDILARIRGA